MGSAPRVGSERGERSGRLARLLDLRLGEGRALRLLVVHAAFAGLPVLLTNIAASALFLARFPASQLPYIYLADAVVVPLASAAFLRLERRLPRHRLLIVIPAAIAGVLIALRVALGWSTNRWIAAAALAMVEVLATLGSLQYWAAANHVLDVRQGKRLLGLVGAGRTAGLVVCGLAVPGLVRWLGTANLLLAAAASSLACLVCLLAIRRAHAAIPAMPAPAFAPSRDPRRRGSRAYVALVLALVAIYHCNYYFIDNAFYDGLTAHYGDADRLSQVLGPIYAINALLLLIVNGLVAGRWLTRFGVSGGLWILPVVGLVSAGAVVGAGVLDRGGLVVACVLVLRTTEYVARNSLYVSALNILYQPLLPSAQIRAQALGEGVAGPIVSGVAGGALLVLGHAGFGVVAICGLVLGLAVVWLPLGWLATRAYYRLVGSLLIPPVARGVEASAPARIAGRSSVKAAVDAPVVAAIRRELATAQDALAAWRALVDQPRLRAALRDEVDAAQGRVLTHLAALDPRPEVGRIERGLRAPALRVFALERLHALVVTVAPALRGPVFALLEETAPERQLARLAAWFPPPERAAAAYVAALASSPAPWHAWTRACALDALDAPDAPDALELASRSADRLIAEAAGRTLSRLYPARFPPAASPGDDMTTLIDKVRLLKTVAIFAETAEPALTGIARVIEDVYAPAGGQVVASGEPGTAMYVVVSGRLRVHDGEQVRFAGPRDVLCEVAALDGAPSAVTVSATEPSHLLRVTHADLHDAMREHAEIAQGVIRLLCERIRQR